MNFKLKSRPKTSLFKFFIGALFLAVLVAGCVSNQDKTSLDNFSKLQTFHLQFIDTYTQDATASKQWNATQFEADVATGNVLFVTALATEQGKPTPDPTRMKAFQLLQDQFQSDCGLLRQKAASGTPFFSMAFSQNLKKIVQANYELALKGEVSRVQKGGDN